MKPSSKAILVRLIEVAPPIIACATFVMARGGSLTPTSAPMLIAIALPFALWAICLRLVESPTARSATIYRLANTLVLLSLGVPVVAGAVHWGIVVLPFALFRIAMNAASKIDEARAITQRIQWIGGAWVAGWAGVIP